MMPKGSDFSSGLDNALHSQRSKSEAALVDAPHRKHLDYLDGWRALAILAVLLGHFAPFGPLNAARFGVELFFMLSGRLMSGILFVEKYPLKKFLKRRVSRVWPALWVFIVACVILLGSNERLRVSVPEAIAAVTFTSNYFSLMYGISPSIEHLWSLAVEEWAYVLLAIVALWSRRGSDPKFLMAGIAIACVTNGVLRTLAGGKNHDVYWMTDVRLSSILIPAAVFLVLRNRNVPSWLPLAAACAGVLLNTYPIPDTLKYSLGTLMLAVAVSTIDYAPRWTLSILSLRALRWIGLMSFSLYLWQQPLYHMAMHSGDIPSIGVRAVYLAVVFVLAYISYTFIENPARRQLNSRWAR